MNEQSPMGLVDFAKDAGDNRSHFHWFVSGDTLSEIAKQYYCGTSRCPEIFEAGQPMLKSPDEIQPGPGLRIPPLAD
jgi:nucleoid-associated protein YgaU